MSLAKRVVSIKVVQLPIINVDLCATTKDKKITGISLATRSHPKRSSSYRLCASMRSWCNLELVTDLEPSSCPVSCPPFCFSALTTKDHVDGVFCERPGKKTTRKKAHFRSTVQVAIHFSGAVSPGSNSVTQAVAR